MVPGMTTRLSPNARRPPWLLPLLGFALAASIGVGAYYNWYLWHPMSGLTITLLALGLLLVGGVGLAIRNRRVRPIALVLIVAGAGAIVGQNVGPDRPETRRHESGSLRLVLTGPAAFDASGDATCGSVADASQVVVDPGEFGLVRESPEADFHYLHVTIGDMYDFAYSNRRDDHLLVTISVQSARIPADIDGIGKPGETRHSSDAASVLTLAPGHTLNGGSITFANLAIGDPPDPSRRSDLAGTISWTCSPVATPGPGSGGTPADGEVPSEEPPPTDVPLPS